jgi:hypothetical protein
MRWKFTIINMALSLVFFPLEFGGLAALAIGFIVEHYSMPRKCLFVGVSPV